MGDKLNQTVTFRIPAEPAKQMEDLAKSLDRTVSWVARQALIVYLKGLEERIE